jgi:Bacterial Ig-like domain (group 3)
VTFPPSNLNLITSGTIMSANGSMVAGNIEGGLGISTPYQWTNGGLVQWPEGTTHSSIAKAVSPDGSVVVGSMGVNSSGDTNPFEWTNGAVTSLTLPAGFVGGSAMGVSSDGATIVGSIAPNVTGNYAEGGTAFIWSQASGIQNLQQVLTADYGLGSSLAGWTLTEATAVTPDGNTIVGTGIDPKGATEAWIATLGLLPPPGGQITPAITWPSPASIVYGTTLSAAQLDASANVSGTYTYSPPTNTLLHAANGQTLSVTFTPNDTTDYTTATATVTINVLRAVPEIVWPTPENIVYGTPLGTAQLDATASWTVAGVFTSVPGTFTYSRPKGDVLRVGNNQQLSASFVPADTADYTNATATVSINVVPTTPVGPRGKPRHTRVVLTAKPLTASVGRAVTFTASVEVRGGDSGTPVGDVVFQDSSTVLGTVYVSGHKVSVKTSSLAPGRDTIQAHFVGTPPFLNSAANITVKIRARRSSAIPAGFLRPHVLASRLHV